MSPAKRTTKTKRAASKSRAKRVVKRAASRAAKPAAPPSWTPHMHDITVVSYNVSDWERAKKFYGETLGLPAALVMDEAGWAEFGFPNQTHLAINKWQGPAPMPTGGGGAAAVFSSLNARQAVEHLRAQGVRCDDAVEIPGMVIFANFYDPDGNRLQLAETPQPTPAQ